ncbi:unnamed protein product [Polarella glacialis]|uniref:Uncharacterized protein n=1 Tax=Polarella glacialis TaxID=89957 RepID=A0A813EAA6_POLGL|nr:unnamed protein product [Polarella glacialis]
MKMFPVPPSEPPALPPPEPQDAAREKLRGKLASYDASYARVPFAYGLIEDLEGRLHFFARAHLERGVVAELLSDGDALEFYAHEVSSPNASTEMLSWAYSVQKPKDEGEAVGALSFARSRGAARRLAAASLATKAATLTPTPQTSPPATKLATSTPPLLLSAAAQLAGQQATHRSRSRSRSKDRRRRRWISLIDRISGDVAVTEPVRSSPSVRWKKEALKTAPSAEATPEVARCKKPTNTMPAATAAAILKARAARDSLRRGSQPGGSIDRTATSSMVHRSGKNENPEVQLLQVIHCLLEEGCDADTWHTGLRDFLATPFQALLDDELQRVNSAISKAALALGLGHAPPKVHRQGVAFTS